MDTTDSELNRVEAVLFRVLNLISGEPGIGKSTLLLQISLKLPIKLYMFLAKAKKIKMRAERITSTSDNCYPYRNQNPKHLQTN
jgi:DNA repair protein RadA/Sms